LLAFVKIFVPSIKHTKPYISRPLATSYEVPL
jgi:hypothetical protein